MSTLTIRAALERLTTMAANELDTPGLWAHSRASWDDAITAARAALAAAPEREPSDEDLYDLAELFNGDPVPAMRRALELWARPAAPPAPLEGEVGELVAELRRICVDVAPCDSDTITRAATLLEQLSAAAQAVVPVTVRFEFEVLDEHDQTVASGDTLTLQEAVREGRHYLSQYQQDGPCELELRRVEVLNSDALPLPAPAPQGGEAQP